MKSSKFFIALVLISFSLAVEGKAVVLTFNDIGLVHGSAVSNQYNGGIIGKDFGVGISANKSSGPNSAFNNAVNVAVAFNTELTAAPVIPSVPNNIGYGFDDDLTRLVSGTSNTAGIWDGGNLPNNTVVGFALIVPENGFGYTPPGDLIFNAPDDNAGNGFIRFTLNPARGYNQIKFVVADFEEVTGFSVKVVGISNTTQTFSASAFLSAADDGNNYLSQLPFIGLYSGVTAGGAPIGSLTGETLKEVDFIFNGASGAISTVELIPEPTSALLFASAVGFLFLRRRRQS